MRGHLELRAEEIKESRRITRHLDNSGDWDCTHHYYHDGQRTVEIRNGSDRLLKQYVWGVMYIDELCQIGINQDPQRGGRRTSRWTRWATGWITW